MMQAFRWCGVAACVALCGCATLFRDDVQFVDIRVVGSDGRSISDAVCHVTNAAQDLAGNSPMIRTEIVRSGSDLEIECRKSGLPLARAVAVSRLVSGVMVAVQPMTMSIVDHFTGRMYDYPDRIDLVIGKEVIVDRNGDGNPVRVRTMPLGTLAAGAAVSGYLP